MTRHHLTDAQVRSILAYGRSLPQSKLAKMFGVDQKTISNVIRRHVRGKVEP